MIKEIKMNKEFISYEQALALKELGFDEPCFGYYYPYYYNDRIYFEGSRLKVSNDCNNLALVKAPLYQQAFRWLYQKLDIENGTMPLDTESQQLLLKELIDKVSSKHLLV
jgi:hypothetical protein